MRQKNFWLVDHIHKILIWQLMFMTVLMQPNLIITYLILVDEKNQQLEKTFYNSTIISTDKKAYIQINIKCPRQNYCKINVVTDTGVQSCLWDLDNYIKYCFKKSKFLPVKRKIVAANREQIEITGAIFMELMA